MSSPLFIISKRWKNKLAIMTRVDFIKLEVFSDRQNPDRR